MSLVVADLADAINQALGPPTDKDGNPIAATAQMTAYANAVITTMHAASFSHASGTVTATGLPAAPITLGTALNGILASVSSGTWAGILAAAFPGATTTAAEASASTGYIAASGKANFTSGKITGTCTATPTNPGILSAGTGANGRIGMLVGSAWATAVLSAIGLASGPLASGVYTAVANYVMTNAALAYASGSVTGAFPSGGGAMTAGTGAAGTIA